MASLGPNDPTAASNALIVGQTWTNPTYCFAHDSNNAQCSAFDTSITSYGLFASGFGFSVPDGSTIDGIIAEIERSISSSTGIVATDDTVRLVKAGSAVGSDLASGASWPSSQAYQTYGGASNLWGTTWTPAEINASDFGLVISAAIDVGPVVRSARINHIRITVHYTLGAGDASGQNMFAVF